MSSKTMKNTMAVGVAAVVGIAGAFAIVTVSPSWAAATLPNVAAMKAAASIQVSDVRYYRRGYARHSYYRRGYYRRGYYGGGYYDPGAAAAAGLALGLFGAAAGRRRHNTTGRPATTRHMATMVTRLIRPTGFAATLAVSEGHSILSAAGVGPACDGFVS